MTITNTLPIIIGHQDTLLQLHLPERGGGRSFFARSEMGHLDLPRAREGGIGGSFFAIFVPSPPDEEDANSNRMTVIQTEKGYEIPYAPAIDPVYAQRVAILMMANLFRLEAESEGQVKVVRTVSELATCLDQGVHAAIMHFEGAEPIDPELDALEVFYQAGPVLELDRVERHARPGGWDVQVGLGVLVEVRGEGPGLDQQRVGQLPRLATVAADRAAVVDQQRE